MSEFTPGPWRIWEGIDVWIMAGDLHVATIPRAYDGDWSKANARLISSAPDMVDDIERMRVHIHKQEFDIITLGQQVGLLRAALHNISLCSQSSMSSKEECGKIARAALAEREVMSDIVEKLRAVEISWSEVGENCAAAADEIEQLRQALSYYLAHDKEKPSSWQHTRNEAEKLALTALGNLSATLTSTVIKDCLTRREGGEVMSDDLLERLHWGFLKKPDGGHYPVNPDGPEAAKEIERLNAENARLREALENLTRRCREYCFDQCRRDCEPMTECRFYRARAALAGEEK